MRSTEPKPIPSPLVPPLWLRVVMFSTAYFIAAVVGSRLALHPGPFVSFWLPSGLFVATLLLNERRHWPWFILAAFPANIGFDLWNGQAAHISFFFCCGNCIEAFAGAWLVRRFVAVCPTMHSVWETVGLTCFSALLSTTLSASLGATVVTQFLGGGPFWNIWLLWWSGDFLGVLLVAPLLLVWMRHSKPPLSVPQRIEALAFVVILCFSATYVFRDDWHHALALKYLMIPFVLWAAFRFGFQIVTLASLMVAVLATWFTVAGFSNIATAGLSPQNQLVSLQLFSASVALVGLFVSAALAEREKAKQSLTEEETRYRAAVETSADGFWIVDMEGRLLEVNDAYVRRSGYSREELLSMRTSDLEAMESPEQTAAHIQRVLRAGNDLFETLHRTKDGTVWQVEVNASYWPIANGRMFAFLRDINRRKRSDALLRMRVKLSDMTAQISLDQVMQAALDEAEIFTGSRIGFFHFVDADQECLTLTTWSTNTQTNMCQAAGKGQHYPISQAGVWVDCFHAKAPVIHNDYANLPHKKGMPEGHAPIVRELAVPILRNGLVTAIFGIGNKPSDYIQDDVEVAQALASLVMDLVEKKRAEEALQESEEKFRTLFEQMNQGVFYQQADGTLIDANPAALELFGLTREEFLARRSENKEWDVIHEDGSPLPAGQHPSIVALKTGQQVRDVVVGVYNPQQKKHVWMIVNAIPQFRHGEKTPCQVFLTIQDITARKAAEEAIRKLASLLSESQEITHVGSWELDPAANRLSWTDEVYRIFGLEPREFRATYEAFLDAVHPEDRLTVDSAYSDSLRERKDTYEIKHRVIRKNTGGVRHVHEICKHLRNAEGEVVRSIGTVQDITEQKNTEDRILRQLDELQRWQAVMLDREDRVQELKREVNELCRRRNEPVRYPSQTADSPASSSGRND